MINFVPFYKDISLTDGGIHKKLKKRLGNVDYRKSLQLLHDSFIKFNKHNRFVIQTDQKTNLPYDCYRSNLSSLNLMESLIVSNLNFVKDNLGKSILVGADNIVVGSVDNFFKEEFDLGFYTQGKLHEDERFNLSNGVVLVNSNNNNHDAIVNFFTLRHIIYKGYDEKNKSWWGDQLSLYHLLSRKNIISEFYSAGNTKKIFDFDGLKIRIFEVNKDYNKWVDSNGNYLKSNDDVILDFPGDQSVKKYMQIIFDSLDKK